MEDQVGDFLKQLAAKLELVLYHEYSIALLQGWPISCRGPNVARPRVFSGPQKHSQKNHQN